MTDTPKLELKPGELCVTLTHAQGLGRWPGAGRIATTTIARVGKRDVVLEDGQRFNREKLSRTTGGAWDQVTTYLLHPRDPRVQAMRNANRKSRCRSEVRTLMAAADEALGRRDLANALARLLDAIAILNPELIEEEA